MTEIEPNDHASPHCACGINDIGQRYVDPICERRLVEFWGRVVDRFFDAEDALAARAALSTPPDTEETP